MQDALDLLQEFLDSYKADKPSIWPDSADSDGRVRDALCAQLLSKLLLPPEAGACLVGIGHEAGAHPELSEEFIINDSADDLLLPRLARDWVPVVIQGVHQAMTPCRIPQLDGLYKISFNISQMAAVHLGSLASSPGCITVYEILRSLGPECSHAADALQALAQQRLFASCQSIQFDALTEQIETFLRSGAKLLYADKSGRVAAHMAAQSDNLLLGRIVRAAPMALLIEDEHGQTPLELLWAQWFDGGDNYYDVREEGGSELIRSLGDAALECSACFPEQTARILQRSQTALEVWTTIADLSGHATLLASSASGADVSQTLGKKLKEVQESADSLVVQLRHRRQRILLLEAFAEDQRFKLSELEPQELKLALAKAQHELEEQQKTMASRLHELEQKNRDLRNTLVQRDEEILELKSCREPQQARNSVIQTKNASAAQQAKVERPAVLEKDKCQESGACDTLRAEEVISEIRNSRHLGAEPAELPEQLRQGILEMRASLAAAVGRLAHDLYESKAHFLQELLQNADDNNYDKDVVPTVRFVLRVPSSEGADKPFFYATNNEIGMREKDVRSLCDISRSSKAGFNGGVTGCKGVGWKSVFRVSDEPHVLCRDWRFKFSSQGLGMITPQWIDDKEYGALPAEVRSAHSQGLTVFYLPLTQHQHVASIESEMNIMKADVVQLLFLRRVRELHLHCSPKSDEVQISLAKESTSTRQIVAASHAPVSQDVQDLVDAGDGRSQVEFEVCKEQDVSLAFPLMSELAPQRIFAVLPVRAAGFKFAINAPFDLTASRTTLHHSLENVCRRDAVVAAFLQCCKANSEVATRSLEYLGNVPSDSFWLPVRTKILEGLQGVPCVMTEAGVVEPQVCMLRGELAAAQWVPDSLLWSACGRHFITDVNIPETMHDLGVSTFGYAELALCLQHAVDQNLIPCMWNYPSRSVLFNDLYSSLYQCLQEEPDRLPEVAALRIFPVPGFAPCEVFISASDPGAKICTSLCDQFPATCQLPLVRCLSNKVDFTGEAGELLKALDIEPLSEEETIEIALSALLQPHLEGQCANLSVVWAALAILQRCFHLDKKMPRPWTEIKDALLLPSAQGGMRPAGSLRLSSFLGVREILPKSVLERVFAIGGFSAPLHSDFDYAALPPSSTLSGSTYFEWEVFFWSLGCSPANPTGELAEAFVETTLQLGGILASGTFWTAASESTSVLQYLDAVIGKGSPTNRCFWLRQLPVRFDEEIVLLEDIFLHEIFHPLAGAHLHYLEGSPSIPRIRTFLAWLGIATKMTKGTLLKCLHCLRSRNVQDIGLISDVYRELSKHEDWKSQMFDWNERLIMVPGVGYVEPSSCTWEPFRNKFLQHFCRLVPLSEHYLRFGQDVCTLLQSCVYASPETDALELCDTLLSAVAACSERVEKQSTEMFEKLFEGAREVVGLLAGLCFEEVSGDSPSCPNSDMVVNCFTENRMIVIPNSGPQQSGGCRVVFPQEAYWSVCEELKGTNVAAYALDKYYGSDVQIQLLFCRVLKVKPTLTPTDLQRMAQNPVSRSSPYPGFHNRQSKLEIGLDLRDLARGLTLDLPSNTAFDPAQALTAALNAARNSTLPQHGTDSLSPAGGQAAASSTAPAPAPVSQERAWVLYWNSPPVYVTRDVVLQRGHSPPHQLLAQFGYPDLGLIIRLGSLFGLAPTQIAFAYDPSGRPVCTEHLFLDITRVSRSLELPGPIPQITFWLMELALAVAHQGLGPRITPHLLQVQTELVALMLHQAWQVPTGGYRYP